MERYPSWGACAPLLIFNIIPGALTNAAGMSNLGNFAPTLIECLEGAPPSNAVNSNFEFAFANGDLFGTYFSTITNFGPVEFTAAFTVTGGTGVFAYATGGFTAFGSVNFTPAGVLVVRNFDGVINVPEPEAWSLLGLGLLGCVALRRRPKKYFVG